MKKIECLQIFTFLHFKMVWSSSFEQNYLEGQIVYRSVVPFKKRRQFEWYYFDEFDGRELNFDPRTDRAWRDPDEPGHQMATKLKLFDLGGFSLFKKC